MILDKEVELLNTMCELWLDPGAIKDILGQLGKFKYKIYIKY